MATTTTTTTTETGLNIFLQKANGDVRAQGIINNHFEPANIIWLLDDYRSKNKLTPELILALIKLDPFEAPNIYPYLQDFEKRLPGVTENAISRWKWNAAWSPDTVFKLLADACIKANRTKEFCQGRWSVGYYYWCDEDPLPIPAIARIDDDGAVLQCAVTREMIIYNGEWRQTTDRTQEFGQGRCLVDYYYLCDEYPFPIPEWQQTTDRKANYEDLIHTPDEKIASMHCLTQFPYDPPAANAYDFKIGSVAFWNQSSFEAEAKFVRHRIQYTPQQAATTQCYLRSTGGLIERGFFRPGEVFDRDITTATVAYQEYEEGLDGKISLKLLNQLSKAKWRAHNRDRTHWQRRKNLYEIVENVMAAQQTTWQIAARDVDCKKDLHGKSLDWVQKNKGDVLAWFGLEEDK